MQGLREGRRAEEEEGMRGSLPAEPHGWNGASEQRQQSQKPQDLVSGGCGARLLTCGPELWRTPWLHPGMEPSRALASEHWGLETTEAVPLAGHRQMEQNMRNRAPGPTGPRDPASREAGERQRDPLS